MSGVVAKRQRQLVCEDLEKRAIAEGMEALRHDGVDAALSVLGHYARRIERLGGTIGF